MMMLTTHFISTTTTTIVLLVVIGTGLLSTSCAGGDEFVDSGHLVWTTIQQQSRSEVDMWTKTSSGCPCSGNSNATTTPGSKNNKNNNNNSKACACCNQGACQCGQKTPYRCAQCGLQQHCDQMCNVTLDASQLYAASKLRYGQIKSLEMLENQVCWYRLQPQTGFRIELQIYRLVDTGQLTNNKSACTGGRLDWMTSGGLRPMTSSTTNTDSLISSSSSSSSSLLPGNYQQHLWRLCGPNERYSPPVLLFSDDDVSPATLILQSGDATRRGKLLAHFSFTPIEHSAPLGLQVVGATPAHGSDCDWHYQQADCLAGAKYNNTCRMASPGYPGLYPPNRKCRYHVAIQSPFQPLTLQFTSVQLPPQRCGTDNVRVYVNGRLHSTLCGQQTLQLITHGPDVVVEFNSGELSSPYVFNGFLAQMSFRTISPDDAAQQGRHRHPSASPVIPPTDIPNGAFRAVERQAHAVCDYVIKPLLAMRTDASSDRARWSGFFSTSITAWKVWPAPCSFSFPTQHGQSVQLSIFTYNLTGADCTSFLDIHEGGGSGGGGSNEARWSSATRRHQICSPSWKKSRNSYSKFNQPFLIQSNNNSSLSVRFRMDPLTGTDQIIEGAFAYYDEFDGQRRQGTLCDTAYDGLDSPPQGFYVHGFDTAVFWPIIGPLNCSSIFTPQDGQTITITIVDSVMKDGDGRCYTDCDRYGCHCRTNSSNVDRVTVSLARESGASQLICLCGDIQAFLPLSLTSNAALSVQQHVNEFTFGQKNLKVQFGYSFSERRQAECGHNLRIDSISGSIKPLYFGLTDKSINQLEGYHHTDCLWVAAIKTTEQWVATVTPPQQGHCEDWNMTFHHYDESWPSRLGDALDLVCPGEGKHVFAMPTVVKIVAVRLQAWGTSPVEYRLDWQTLSLAPRPTPAAAAGVQRSLSSLITTSVPAVVIAAAVPVNPATTILAKSVASMFTGGLLHQSYMFLLLLLVAVLSLRF